MGSQLEFRKLLRNISQRLTSENMNMICYLCKDLMPEGSLVEEHPAMSFLEYCENEGYFDSADMGFLAEVLYRISRHDLLKLLPDVKNRKAYESHLNSIPIAEWNFKPFRISCLKLYDELDHRDFITLKNLCKDHVTPRNYARSKDVFSLLNCLEEEDIVSEDDLEFITNILKHLDNQKPHKMFLQLADGDCNFCLPKQHAISLTDKPNNTSKVFHSSDDHENCRVFNREHSMNIQTSTFDQYHENESFFHQSNQISPARYPASENNFAAVDCSTSKTFFNDSTTNSEQTKSSNPNQQYSRWPVRATSSESDQSEPLVSLHNQGLIPNMNSKQHLPYLTAHTPAANHMYQQNDHTTSSSCTYEKSLFEPDSNPSNQNSHSSLASTISPRFKSVSLKELSSSTLGRYIMKNNPCGLCVIINNEKFEGRVNYPDASRRLNTDDMTSLSREVPSLSLKDRPGSQTDVQNLQSLFTGFGFKIETYENLEKREMEACLKKYAQEQDHSSYDCFVCVVMSHGLEGTVYGVDGLTLQVSWIHKLFRPGNCATLTDKPKIFFFQACQGERRMGGQYVPNSDVDEVEHDSPSVECEITFTTPNEADFLIGHSTVPGYLSYRHRAEGSWFISSLVNNLEKYHENEDVLSILIKVNRDMCKKPLNQMPMPIATLRKKVYFSKLLE